MTAISLNQRSFLLEKAKDTIEDVDTELLWRATAGMEEKNYAYILAQYYNDKPYFKQLIHQEMYP